MTGAIDPTIKVAESLVALPAELVTTQLKVAPLSPGYTAESVYVELAAQEY
jgi:hypothetical protein